MFFTDVALSLSECNVAILTLRKSKRANPMYVYCKHECVCVVLVSHSVSVIDWVDKYNPYMENHCYEQSHLVFVDCHRRSLMLPLVFFIVSLQMYWIKMYTVHFAI